MTENTLRQRASRHKRLKDPPRIRLTDRDKQVVKAVNDFRVMRQDQVQRLLFPSKNTAQNRLWLLWQNNFLKRAFLPLLVGSIQNSPILYQVDKEGVDLLQAEFGYEKEDLRYSPRTVGQQFLRHTLGLGEIQLALTLSCREHGYSLDTWRDEKAMKADFDHVTVGSKKQPVLPDAYFAVRIPKGKMHFLLEFDRGPERIKIFKKKILSYRAYFRSSKPEKRYGTYAIRVLTVVEGSQTRLKNLKKMTEESKGGDHFWFSTLEQVSTEDAVSSPIWQVAGKSDLTPLYAM